MLLRLRNFLTTQPLILSFTGDFDKIKVINILKDLFVRVSYPHPDRTLSANWACKLMKKEPDGAPRKYLVGYKTCDLVHSPKTMEELRQSVGMTSDLGESIPWGYQLSVLLELGARFKLDTNMWQDRQRFYLLPPVGEKIKADHVEQTLNMFVVKVQNSKILSPDGKSFQKILILGLANYSEDDAPFFDSNDVVLLLRTGRI